MDVFIKQAFTHSKKSDATRKMYTYWLSRCCAWNSTPHPLDLTPEQIQALYLDLHSQGVSLSTLEVVRSALLYTYTVLLVDETPPVFRVDTETSQAVKALFDGRRRHAYHLPSSVTQEDIARFFEALPESYASEIIREVYHTGKRVGMVQEGKPKKYAVAYLQQLCSAAAREAGIPHGFGLRGVRASGIIHRIQKRKNDLELKAIMEDAGIEIQQFTRYMQAAGAK